MHIVNSKIDTPKLPAFKFDLAKKVAIHNKNMLVAFNNSIQKFIEANPGTIVSPGLEFRPAYILEPLFLHHHNWPSIQRILLSGSLWPLLPISKEDRIAKSSEFILRGNHKSVDKYKSRVDASTPY
jgi:hypothetical protein